MLKRHRLLPKSHLKLPGTAPGTLIVPEQAPEPVVTVMAFNRDELTEKVIENPEEIKPFLKKGTIVWVNVDGLGDADLLKKLGEIFGLHTLALEDVLNVHHRPKVEEYDKEIFIITRMACLRNDVLDIEQVSFFLGKNFVVSFQERPGDCLEPVRERIRKGGQRIRFMEADYLAYALLDAIVDGYFPVLEHFSERLNALEDVVVGNPDKQVVEQTHEIKRDLQVLRHGIWPLREALSRLSGDMPLIHDETKLFLRDCYDHVIQIIDILETYRERAAGLTDLYLSSLSNKMNEVMKVLTIIATIFMPLGFIAGLYGMNFDPDVSPLNMPELRWYFGYPFALGLMALFAAGLLIYFWRKGWIGRKN